MSGIIQNSVLRENKLPSVNSGQALATTSNITEKNLFYMHCKPNKEKNLAYNYLKNCSLSFDLKCRFCRVELQAQFGHVILFTKSYLPDPLSMKNIVFEEKVDFFIVLFELSVMLRKNTVHKKFNSFIATTLFSLCMVLYFKGMSIDKLFVQ